jgi:hypothetical protein
MLILLVFPKPSSGIPRSTSFATRERFKAFTRKAGYVDYWRAKGWPDLCQTVGTDDFARD